MADYLQLKLNVPVEAEIKELKPWWEGTNKFGNYQFNYNLLVNGVEKALCLSDKSPALQEIKTFNIGDKIAIIKKELDGGKSAIRIYPRGDINVQPQNIGLPSGKENFNQHVKEMKQEDKNLEYKKAVCRGCCMNIASRLIASGIVSQASDDAVEDLYQLTGKLCKKFHPDLFN